MMTVVTMGATEVMVVEAAEAMVVAVAVAVAVEVKGRECEFFVPFGTAAYHTMQLTVP
jgi:hypothetical protein